MTSPEDMDDGANRGKVTPNDLWDQMKGESAEWFAYFDQIAEQERNAKVEEIKKKRGGSYKDFM